MKTVHWTLNPKGGVGKSFVASLIAQRLQDRGENPGCYDTDPSNATFTGFKALDVKRVEVQDRNLEVNIRAFDPMMEVVLGEDRSFVIDNGSGTFVPLSNYLVQNGVFDMIADAGKQSIVHTVVTGGQALRDTLGGFVALASNLPESAKLVVWLNEYFGPVEHNGKAFEDLEMYQENKGNVLGIIRIPDRNKETFGHDIRTMLEERLTFNEVLQSPTVGVMPRQRLTQVRRDLWARIDQVL